SWDVLQPRRTKPRKSSLGQGVTKRVDGSLRRLAFWQVLYDDRVMLRRTSTLSRPQTMGAVQSCCSGERANAQQGYHSDLNAGWQQAAPCSAHQSCDMLRYENTR